jgi:hypothetical protein
MPTAITFVALLEPVEHRLVLLRLLHLRPDHEEVEDHEHQDDGQEAHQRFAALRRSGGLGVCGTNHGDSSGKLLMRQAFSAIGNPIF